MNDEHIGFLGVNWRTYGLVEPGELWHAENLYPMDPSQRSAWMARPRFKVDDGTNLSTPVHLIGSWDVSGSRRTFAVMGDIAGDASIRASIGGGGWVEYISQAEMTTAVVDISLANSDMPMWAEYNGKAVFVDQTNQPFSWDGGNASGDLTKLTNAPATVAFHRPTVYYGKLFFIKEGNTIVWSEENQENVGYEANGYNNAWDLKQTSGADVTAIHATNRALFYWRRSGIGVIEGAVTPNFRTTGVHDAISTEIGTRSPLSTYWARDTMFWVDEHNRPFAWRDGEIYELWQQLAGWYKESATANPFGIQGLPQAAYVQRWRTSYSPETGQILFWYTTDYNGLSGYYYRQALAFDLNTLRFTGFWTISSSAKAYAPADVYDGANSVNTTGIAIKSSGMALVAVLGQGNPEGDELTASTYTYEDKRLIYPPQYRGKLVSVIDQIDVVAKVDIGATTTDATRISARPITSELPYNDVAPAYQTKDLQYEQATADTEQEHGLWQKATFGVDVRARWAAIDAKVESWDTSGDAARDGDAELGILAVNSRVEGIDEEPEDV
jgi:hypothetical protein